jgi:hypothetical protein
MTSILPFSWIKFKGNQFAATTKDKIIFYCRGFNHGLLLEENNLNGLTQAGVSSCKREKNNFILKIPIVNCPDFLLIILKEAGIWPKVGPFK